MKILGHIYIAIKALPKHNRQLLTWGSILPDMAFYVEDNPFDYKEIHEGGIRVLDFLKKEKPAWTDLALGILSHSSKFGADHFNEFKQLEQLGYFRGKDAEFEQKVREAANLTNNLPEAQIRVHNLLDLALDLYISRTYPEALTELKSAFRSVPASEIAKVLADCFGKEKSEAQAAINKLKEKIKPDDLTTVDGLARTWVRFSTALSEQEKDLSATKIEGVIKESVKRIRGKEEDFLQAAVEWTRKNLEQIYTHSKERLF